MAEGAYRNLLAKARGEQDPLVIELASALERTLSEMHARELHHFETEQKLAQPRASAFREAANDVRLVFNGGGHGKSAVWFLIDKADRIERGEE